MGEYQGLLSGIRVVELASIIMAPACATVLADFGADVVKIEPPTGDQNRYIHLLTGMPESEMPFAYLQANRSKKGIVLNLKDPDGIGILHRLLESADIFITNFRPGAIGRMDLRYEDIKARYPKLIYAQASGFGEEGAEADRPGYDVITYWCRSGIEGTMFPAEGWLAGSPPGSGDNPSGMALFGSIMAALYRREKTGEGCKVLTSLLANGAWANSCLIQAQLCGANFLEKRPRKDSYNFIGLHYRTQDERLLKLSIANIDRDWPAFCRAMGRDDLIDDPKFATAPVRAEHMSELISILDGIFGSHDLAHWRNMLKEHDIPHAILPEYSEIAADAQMEANGVFTQYEHPRFGALRTVNSPISILEEPKRAPFHPPELGEHTREVLGANGYGAEEIEDFLARGVAMQLPG